MAYKNLLITGSNGCVGQYLIDWFLKNTEFKLYLMVRDIKKLPISVRTNKRIKLLVCDIRQSIKFRKEINKVHFFIHTATAWGDPKRAYEVNITAFEDLLKMLNRNKLEKIIYFSTASILNKQTDLMRESLIYGTEYIQTKYECYERLKKSEFAKRTIVVFPTLVFGGTLKNKSKYPISYLTQGLKEINKWLWLARFFKIESKFHFIHARDIAQICGLFLVNQTYLKNYGFKKFVLGQNHMTVDEAVEVLLERNGIRRYFAFPLTKQIIRILLKVLPIQATAWDIYSIKKYNFNHEPITNPETLGLKSYYGNLKSILNVSKLPRCNIN